MIIQESIKNFLKDQIFFLNTDKRIALNCTFQTIQKFNLLLCGKFIYRATNWKPKRVGFIAYHQIKLHINSIKSDFDQRFANAFIYRPTIDVVRKFVFSDGLCDGFHCFKLMDFLNEVNKKVSAASFAVNHPRKG